MCDPKGKCFSKRPSAVDAAFWSPFAGFLGKPEREAGWLPFLGKKAGFKKATEGL